MLSKAVQCSDWWSTRPNFAKLYAMLLFLIFFSTRRMLLGRTPNLADPFSKTTVKATAGKRDFVICFVKYALSNSFR